MIELRYNADGELEYRTAITVGQYRGLYANSYAGELQWDDWKIVPSEQQSSAKKETAAPVDNNLRTERVTLEFRIEGSPPTQWPWSYILSRSDAIKMRPGESVRVVDETAEAVRQSAAWDGARQAYSDGLARLTAERDAARTEAERLRHLLTTKEREYEQVKKELDEIKNSSTPVAWGVRMPETKLWRCSSEKQAKKCVEYFGKGEVVTLFEKPQPILTQAEQKAVEYAHGLIKYYATIADRRYDYNTYYHDHRDALAGLLARYKLVAGGEVE